MKRLPWLNLAPVLLATVLALLWIRAVGGFEGLSGLTAVRPLYLAAMVGLTALCVLVRFVRWQFLMRHAGIRLTERPSLLIYLASLLGTATPAYIGEAIRGPLIRREFGVPLRVSLFVLIVERLTDVLALALLAGGATNTWLMRGLMVAIFSGAVLALLVAFLVARAAGFPDSVLRILRRPDVVLDSLALSIAAWALTAFHVSLGAASIGISVSALESLRVFTSAVLLGGLTLMPAGIGATGSLAILQLESLRVSISQAVLVVALVRLTTVGATLLVGAVCLFVIFRAATRGAPARDAAATHFDDIATEYGEQFAPHVWYHLLERKVGLIAAALPAPGAAGQGLDLGCGLGSQCLTLTRRGYRVFGMDVAFKLAARARQAGVSVAAGSALALPFRDQSLNFVYAVGVLHHLPNRQAQRIACQEAARVLKPGGVFVVHETNTRNPVFRLYMGYVFPLLRRIDEGTEWWIEPSRWSAVAGFRLVKLDHFTFMPDFIPSWLMKPFLAVDRRLEASRLRPYSVHYMAVLERDPSWSRTVLDHDSTEESDTVDRVGGSVTNAEGR